MIDINYDEVSKEFYVSFQDKRYSITNHEINNLKDKLNSLESQTLQNKENGN
jgi:hypothetical protein